MTICVQPIIRIRLHTMLPDKRILQLCRQMCHCSHFFGEKSNSVAMIPHIMNNNAAATQFLNPGQTPVLTMDQPWYALAKQLQWRFPNLYGEDKYVIILGGLHTEIAALRTIGDPWRKWMDSRFNPGRHWKCRYLWRIPSCISCDQNPQGTPGYCRSFILVAA